MIIRKQKKRFLNSKMSLYIIINKKNQKNKEKNMNYQKKKFKLKWINKMIIIIQIKKKWIEKFLISKKNFRKHKIKLYNKLSRLVIFKKKIIFYNKIILN